MMYFVYNSPNPPAHGFFTSTWINIMEECQPLTPCNQYRLSLWKRHHGQNIKNNAWVTVNNDIWSRVRWFANDFHVWRSHEWKSSANHLTSDHKIVVLGNECIILFLTHYYMSWTHHSAANKHRSIISPLSLWTVFSDLTLWRRHSWSITSHERDARHWHCDVIFVDCSCTHKLEQRWSSLVNKYSSLMHCIKIKSPAKSLLNEQYVFVGGNIYFLCVLSCSSEEA